jgi:hypothetical protein
MVFVSEAIASQRRSVPDLHVLLLGHLDSTVDDEDAFTIFRYTVPSRVARNRRKTVPPSAAMSHFRPSIFQTFPARRSWRTITLKGVVPDQVRLHCIPPGFTLTKSGAYDAMTTRPLFLSSPSSMPYPQYRPYSSSEPHRCPFAHKNLRPISVYVVAVLHIGEEFVSALVVVIICQRVSSFSVVLLRSFKLRIFCFDRLVELCETSFANYEHQTNLTDFDSLSPKERDVSQLFTQQRPICGAPANSTS